MIDGIIKSWDDHMNALLDFDFSSCEDMNIRSLETVRNDNASVSLSVLNYLGNKDAIPVSLKATFYDVDEDANMLKHLETDDSVVVYTDQISSRPWLGLITKQTDKGSVEVQWLKQCRTMFTPQFNKDGSPYVSIVPKESLMFSNILENTSKDLGRDGPYKLSADMRRQINQAYIERDSSF